MKADLSYRIIGFEIWNYKGIKRIFIEELGDHVPWLFITGKNAFGKSCVLQALFTGVFGEHEKQKDRSAFHNGGLISLPEKILVKLSTKKGEITLTNVYSNTYGEETRPSIPVCAYGSSRLNLRSADLSDHSEKQKSLPSYSLFNPDGILLNIEAELKNWACRSQNRKLSDDNPELAGKLASKVEEVTKVLLKLMPNIAQIIIDPEKDVILYQEKDEHDLPLEEYRTFSELASGNQSLIAMVGDMLIRLFEMQQNVSRPEELEGIVLIDELDLHLHPSWQKKLPALLSDLFPKIQFIASTHSAIPLLGAPEKSVILKVNRTKEEGITLEKLEIDIANLTPNQVLSSPIFDFHELIAASNEEVGKVHTETSYSDVLFRKELKRRLQSLAEDGEVYEKTEPSED